MMIRFDDMRLNEKRQGVVGHTELPLTVTLAPAGTVFIDMFRGLIKK